MRNKTIMFVILIFVIVAGFLFFKGFTKPNIPSQTPSPSQKVDDSSAQIIKTVPDPLNEAIVPTDQVIEFYFNKPLQNAPEFKVKIEPKIDFKVELSSDRKTAKIITSKPFDLGATYTLYIGPDTKFDGVGNWGQDKTFQFRTVRYRGI